MIEIDAIWPAFMECRRWMGRKGNDPVPSWTFVWDGRDQWSFKVGKRPDKWHADPNTIVCDLASEMPDGFARRLELTGLYLRVLHAGYRARRAGTVFVTANFAQSLDGYMATTSGDSQWIGNEANLVHSHRLRSLHDGILVGAKTLRIDHPQLTVRHVEGPNPLRLVITRGKELDKEMIGILAKSPPTCLIHHAANQPVLPEELQQVTCLPVQGNPVNGCIAPELILRALAARGSHSLMIEGGGMTLSKFLSAGLIDELQIHIAPMILGNGVSPLQLTAFDSMDRVERMPSQTFPMEDQVLYSLRPKGAAP